jgi:hypothetical protein
MLTTCDFWTLIDIRFWDKPRAFETQTKLFLQIILLFLILFLRAHKLILRDHCQYKKYFDSVLLLNVNWHTILRQTTCFWNANDIFDQTICFLFVFRTYFFLLLLPKKSLYKKCFLALHFVYFHTLQLLSLTSYNWRHVFHIVYQKCKNQLINLLHWYATPTSSKYF